MNDDRRRVLRLAERVLVYLADDDDDSMRITMASTLREQADLNSRRLQDVRNRDKRIAELEAENKVLRWTIWQHCELADSKIAQAFHRFGLKFTPTRRG